MIKVAGHWEIGNNCPLLESIRWVYPLREFEVNQWWMHPITGINNNEQSRVPLYEKNTIQEILKENQDVVHVYVEPRNKAENSIKSVDLRDFKHPKDVLYIFGSANFSPHIGNKRDKDLAVTVETVQNKGVPWADQILMVILYDRFIKENY